MAVGEQPQRGRLARAGGSDHADDAVGSCRGLVDEHALLAREPGGRLVQHPRQQPPVRGRRADIAAGERELERFVLDLQQLPGREPRRPTRHLSRLEQLDARQQRQLLRHLEHLHDRRPVSQRARDRAHELGHRERGLRRGQRQHSGRELLRPDRSGRERTLTDEPLELTLAESVLGRACQPLLAQPRQVDLLLRLAGRERGDAGGGEAVCAECLHVLEQRLPPGRERPHRLLRHPDQVRHPLDRLRPLQPKPPGELVPQLGLVEVAGGEPVGAQDRLAVERPPLAIRRAGHVGDDHVRVQMRVLRARGAMPERRRHEPLAVLAHRAAVAAAHDAGLALEIAERRLPGRLVRLTDLAPRRLVVGERVQQADALRAREHEVVPGHRREPLRLLAPLAALDVEPPHRDRPLPHRRPQHRAARRVDAAQQRPEPAVLDHAREPERRSTATGPEPRRLAAAGVVVVQPARDLLLVVGLLPERELRHAQHLDSNREEHRGQTQMHPRCEKEPAFSEQTTTPPNACPTTGAQKPASGRIVLPLPTAKKSLLRR